MDKLIPHYGIQIFIFYVPMKGDEKNTYHPLGTP